MTEFVEIHAIQPLGPNCINRDDAGDPKTILLNGTLRARVSSQAWKKAMRDAMRGMDLPDVGLRTKRVAIEVARRGGVDVGDAKAVLGLAKAGLEGKDGTDDAGALILIGSNTLNRLGALAAEYATAEDGKAWLADKANAKAVKAVLKEDHAVDLALFGRMVASNPEYGVEAAANVAHAIGVGAFEPEYDFFSAVDDLRGAYGETDKGSGGAMIGDIAYGDATIYRYAVVDMARLESNLAGPMQSWGVADRHTRRGTMPCPTMSGVCGLIAACLGLEHGADLAAEFDGVRFSVREDERPGRLSDFQTVGAGTKTAKVVVKDYLTGAAYTAALEADRPRLERWAEALRHPAHAVGLGRRGCPPSRPFAPRIEDAPAAGLFAGSHWWTGSPEGDAWVDAPVRRDGNGGVWNTRAVAEHGGDFFDGI